jgi:hypothetical protein
MKISEIADDLRFILLVAFALALVFLILTGCAQRKYASASKHPVFGDIYKQAVDPPRTGEIQEVSPIKLSVSAAAMPVPEFFRYVATQADVSVVWDESLDAKLVSLELTDVPLPELFGMVARRLGVQIGRVGSTWYVGTLRGEDRGFMVRKVRRLPEDGLKAAVQVMLSDAGKLATYADGLLVCGDRVEVLQRIASLLDSVESVGAESWVVQLYLLSVSKEASSELGLDIKPLADVSYTFAAKSLVSPAAAAELSAALSGALKASSKRQDVRVVAQPLFLLIDGESSSFSSGASIPVPKKAVSNQGTITTQSYEMVNTGLAATVSIREMSAAVVRCRVKVDLGQVTGFVESAPIQAKDSFETVSVLAAGGVYLLGALDRSETSKDSSGPLPQLQGVRSRSDKANQIQIWARLYRIAGPAIVKK